MFYFFHQLKTLTMSSSFFNGIVIPVFTSLTKKYLCLVKNHNKLSKAIVYVTTFQGNEKTFILRSLLKSKNLKMNQKKVYKMKILFFISSLLLISNIAFSQTLQDIQKLKQLQQQIESGAVGIQTQEKQTENIKSLETFDDKLSSIPKEKLKSVTIDPQNQGAKSNNEALSINDEFDRLKAFGYSIFSEAKMDLKPTFFGPVSKDYPLGPGDEVIITLWGEVEIRHSLTIDRNGQIMVPDVGLINLTGLTMEKSRIKLFNIMKNYYSGLKYNKITLEVTLGKLRSIRIFVTGEVKQPGVFTVPAYVSPFAMLFYAAGVKPNGSLRHVIVMRGGKQIADLDFYALLVGIEKEDNLHLQNQDIIVVPPAENKVHLAGAVGTPAIYEFKPGETLQELIGFAGNLKPDAYLKQIEIIRFIPHRQPVLVNVDFTILKKNDEKLTLMAGDRVYVYQIMQKRENYVNINGPIFGPKRFSYSEGLTIKQIFNRVDSIKADAYLERAIITRKLENDRTEMYSVNLKTIIDGSSKDFALEPMDEISFKSINSLFPIDSVSIYGAVNHPGKYLLSKNLTLKDLLYQAGGFTLNAKKDVAEVSRLNFSDNNEAIIANIIKVPLDTTYGKGNNSQTENFLLQPFDNVFIYIDSNWELQRNVTIRGEVFRPGTYSLKTKEDKLSDLIERAGGIKPTGFIAGAKFFRRKDNAGQIGLNFIEAVEDPYSDENIILEDGDRVVIPQRRYTVKVIGGVNFPSSVLFNSTMELKDYIDAAGGLTELADEENISVMLANGKRIKEKSFLFFPYLPEDISPGSTIYIPTLATKEVTDWSGAIRDAAAILGSVASVILIINQINR